MPDPAGAENSVAIERLVTLMEEQVSLLRSIDRRQETSNVKEQPFAGVSATSNGTWGALLHAVLSETIQPQVDRWKSGLDALLVFLGLFSAIVTPFLVEALSSLHQDEAARTNELLANLTDIMIALNRGDSQNLNPHTAMQFQPNSAIVRLNVYWSLSLVLSICIAALAVVCRGFLNMVVLSFHSKATVKLIDIRMRWAEAKNKLGPFIEVIPQLLVIPLLLFLVGLLDNILTSVLQLAVLPVPILVATVLSLVVLAGVMIFLGYSLLDGSIRSHNSPFQSTLARMIGRKIFPAPNIETVGLVSTHYHESVQTIYDNHTLDQASAALHSILHLRKDSIPNFSQNPLIAVEEEKTVVHLLSQEASTGANLTVAAALIKFYRSMARAQHVPGADRVVKALIKAAERSVIGVSLATLETSLFLEAMAALLVGNEDLGTGHPPIVQILCSQYLSIQHTSDSKLEVIKFICDILSALGPEAVQLLRPTTIKTTQVLQALCRFPDGFDYDVKRNLITGLLLQAKPGESVIQDAMEVPKLLNHDCDQSIVMVDLLCGHKQLYGHYDELLLDLCIACICEVKMTRHSRPKTGKLMSNIVKIMASGPGERTNLEKYQDAAQHCVETRGFLKKPETTRKLLVAELTEVLVRMNQPAQWRMGMFDLENILQEITV